MSKMSTDIWRTTGFFHDQIIHDEHEHSIHTCIYMTARFCVNDPGLGVIALPQSLGHA